MGFVMGFSLVFVGFHGFFNRLFHGFSLVCLLVFVGFRWFWFLLVCFLLVLLCYLIGPLFY